MPFNSLNLYAQLAAFGYKHFQLLLYVTQVACEDVAHGFHIRSAIFKHKPAEGSEADAPEKHERDHCLPFLIFT
jgi:hypothetical protein